MARSGKAVAKELAGALPRYKEQYGESVVKDHLLAEVLDILQHGESTTPLPDE